MKKKFYLLAIIFFLISGVSAFIIFYQLANIWEVHYKLMFSSSATLFLELGLLILFRIPFSRFSQWLYQHIIVKILIELISTIVFFGIFYWYSLPIYYYVLFFFLSIFFFFSNSYFIFFVTSKIMFFWTFIIFQFFLLQQEYVLNQIENHLLKKSIPKEISIQIKKKEPANQTLVSIVYHNTQRVSTIEFKFPKQMEVQNIEETNENLKLPSLFMAKAKEKEFPIMFSIIIPKNYPVELLDLRVQSILQNLKRKNRIEKYEKYQNPYFSDLLEKKNFNISIFNQFFLFYDKFYADWIQLGYYGIPLGKYYILIWIREKKRKGFPHHSIILEILNSITIQHLSNGK